MPQGNNSFGNNDYCTFEDLLKNKGYLLYTNIGTSMMPLLRARRDVIEIQSKSKERCEKYDVVLYKRGNRYILHRILKVLPDNKYLIAGDNNTFIEKDITDDRILGIMTKVIRNGKAVTPDNIWYKIYVHLWCDVYPVRMIIIRMKKKIINILWTAKKRIFGEKPLKIFSALRKKTMGKSK